MDIPLDPTNYIGTEMLEPEDHGHSPPRQPPPARSLPPSAQKPRVITSSPAPMPPMSTDGSPGQAGGRGGDKFLRSTYHDRDGDSEAEDALLAALGDVRTPKIVFGGPGSRRESPPPLPPYASTVPPSASRSVQRSLQPSLTEAAIPPPSRDDLRSTYKDQHLRKRNYGDYGTYRHRLDAVRRGATWSGSESDNENDPYSTPGVFRVGAKRRSGTRTPVGGVREGRDASATRQRRRSPGGRAAGGDARGSNDFWAEAAMEEDLQMIIAGLLGRPEPPSIPTLDPKGGGSSGSALSAKSYYARGAPGSATGSNASASTPTMLPAKPPIVPSSTGGKFSESGFSVHGNDLALRLARSGDEDLMRALDLRTPPPGADASGPTGLTPRMYDGLSPTPPEGQVGDSPHDQGRPAVLPLTPTGVSFQSPGRQSTGVQTDSPRGDGAGNRGSEVATATSAIVAAAVAASTITAARLEAAAAASGSPSRAAFGLSPRNRAPGAGAGAAAQRAAASGAADRAAQAIAPSTPKSLRAERAAPPTSPTFASQVATPPRQTSIYGPYAPSASASPARPVLPPAPPVNKALLKSPIKGFAPPPPAGSLQPSRTSSAVNSPVIAAPPPTRERPQPPEFARKKSPPGKGVSPRGLSPASTTPRGGKGTPPGSGSAVSAADPSSRPRSARVSPRAASPRVAAPGAAGISIVPIDASQEGLVQRQLQFDGASASASSPGVRVAIPGRYAQGYRGFDTNMLQAQLTLKEARAIETGVRAVSLLVGEAYPEKINSPAVHARQAEFPAESPKDKESFVRTVVMGSRDGWEDTQKAASTSEPSAPAPTPSSSSTHPAPAPAPRPSAALTPSVGGWQSKAARKARMRRDAPMALWRLVVVVVMGGFAWRYLIRSYCRNAAHEMNPWCLPFPSPSELGLSFPSPISAARYATASAHQSLSYLTTTATRALKEWEAQGRAYLEAGDAARDATPRPLDDLDEDSIREALARAAEEEAAAAARALAAKAAPAKAGSKGARGAAPEEAAAGGKKSFLGRFGKESAEAKPAAPTVKAAQAPVISAAAPVISAKVVAPSPAAPKLAPSKPAEQAKAAPAPVVPASVKAVEPAKAATPAKPAPVPAPKVAEPAPAVQSAPAAPAPAPAPSAPAPAKASKDASSKTPAPAQGKNATHAAAPAAAASAISAKIQPATPVTTTKVQPVKPVVAAVAQPSAAASESAKRGSASQGVEDKKGSGLKRKAVSDKADGGAKAPKRAAAEVPAATKPAPALAPAPAPAAVVAPVQPVKPAAAAPLPVSAPVAERGSSAPRGGFRLERAAVVLLAAGLAVTLLWDAIRTLPPVLLARRFVLSRLGGAGAATPASAARRRRRGAAGAADPDATVEEQWLYNRLAERINAAALVAAAVGGQVSQSAARLLQSARRVQVSAATVRQTVTIIEEETVTVATRRTRRAVALAAAAAPEAVPEEAAGEIEAAAGPSASRTGRGSSKPRARAAAAPPAGSPPPGSPLADAMRSVLRTARTAAQAALSAAKGLRSPIPVLNLAAMLEANGDAGGAAAEEVPREAKAKKSPAPRLRNSARRGGRKAAAPAAEEPPAAPPAFPLLHEAIREESEEEDLLEDEDGGGPGPSARKRRELNFTGLRTRVIERMSTIKNPDTYSPDRGVNYRNLRSRVIVTAGDGTPISDLANVNVGLPHVGGAANGGGDVGM